MRKTVLVLGAGASVDFDLPTGEGLSKTIEESLTFRFTDDHNVTGDSALRMQGERGPDAPKFFEAAQRLATALPYSTSIDDVLYKFGDDRHMVDAGKAAIIAAVLHAEKNSWLHQTTHPQGNPVATLRSRPDVWLHRFLRFVQSNTPVAQAASAFDGLSIINFNYDRCLEHYLHTALQPAFAMDADRAARIVNGLTILHPYGTVGPLPWQASHEAKVSFGTGPAQVKLLEIARNIRTFSEQLADSEDEQKARMLIRDAERIVFLGFGFHSQNMALIGPKDRAYTGLIFGTVLGTSHADQDVFTRRIVDSFFGGAGPFSGVQARFHFEASRCGDFINTYGLQLFR
jgi:hypothetical protein